MSNGTASSKDKHLPVDQALIEARSRLAGILASAMDAIITVDSRQEIILFNQAAEAMFGYASHAVIGKPLGMLLPERFRAQHRQHVQRFGETGVTNRTMGKLGTLYGLRANGEEFPIEASISQVKLDEGALYTVILRDVSERAAAEQRLVESERTLQATFEQAAVGIAHSLPEGQFLRVNQKMLEITGYDRSELLKKTFQEISYPEDLAGELVLHRRILQGAIQTYTIEKRYVRKDGGLIWVNLAVALVRDAAGNPKHLMKIVEDITERKRAEAALNARTNDLKSMTQQLWHTARLATMGELAASVAHELNNPLAILSLRIEALLSEKEQTDLEYRDLKVMEQEVERMASLVSNLLQFSRSSERQISSLDVREEVEQTLELVHNYLANRRVLVERDFSPELPLIQADRQQLRQLFLNLFSNAADAMPEGGTLSIRIAPLREQRSVQIELQDSGVGIPPAQLPHVLEPFYTTKKEGKGTGLGLSICRRIVDEHHGVFRITSDGPGKGVIVRIILPETSGSSSILLV
jgi:PAS domain S-box-containing protein